MLNNEVRAAIRSQSAPLAVPAYNAMACVHVESAGVTFWTVKGKLVPAARPEGHYFHARLKGSQLDAAVRAGLAHPDFRVSLKRVPSSREAVYDMIERMKAINESAALESCSWGLGQVMGANWKSLGYGSVQELVAENMRGVDGQIACMFRFIKANGLVDELQRGDFAGFAHRYNGPAYKQMGYHTKMASLAATYRKLEEGAVTIEVAASEEIKKIQTTLKRLGFYQYDVDGFEGAKTTAGIKAFQHANGLVDDGKWGTMTAKVADEKIAELDLKAANNKTGLGVGGAGAGTLASGVIEQVTLLKTFVAANPVISTAITVLTLAAVALAIYGMVQRFRNPAKG